MLKRQWTILVVAFWVASVGILPPLLAAEGGAEPEPVAVTISDPEIPVDELALLLKPFSKDELLVEAGGWQELLQEKAREIATAEIAVKRQNREIKQAAEIQGKADEVREQLAEVKQRVEVAKATGDADKIRETQEAADEAHVRMQELGSAVDEAADAAAKTALVRDQLTDEAKEGLGETADAADRAQEALGRVQDAVEAADPDDEKSVRSAVHEVKQATEEAEQATTEAKDKAGEVAQEVGLGEEDRAAAQAAVEAMEEAETAKKEEKVQLLENVNLLREERTVIIDRLTAVLDELETKTDAGDADTLARIVDYRLYIQSVSGITLDVTDTTSAWVAIKGWMVSEEGGLRWATNIGTFVGILFIAWFLSKLISRAVHRALGMTDKVSQLLEDFLVGAARWVVMIIGVLMALSSLEISVGPLLALVGAAGFVIALALQDSLSNFASGIMILFFRPFDVGDVVDAGGVSGSVTTMNLVATTIKTFDNKKMVVPNNKVWRDVITNATGVKTRRVDMEFGIGYDDDMDRAHAILEEVVKEHPKVLADPAPTIRMHALADSSVNFICRPWTNTEDYWGVYWDVTREVKKRFDAADIGIPFPQRDVHLYLEDGSLEKKLSDISGAKAQEAGADPQPFELDDEKDNASDG